MQLTVDCYFMRQSGNQYLWPSVTVNILQRLYSRQNFYNSVLFCSSVKASQPACAYLHICLDYRFNSQVFSVLLPFAVSTFSAFVFEHI